MASSLLFAVWSLFFIRVLPPLPPSVFLLEPTGPACHCCLLACGLHMWEQTGHRLAQLWLLHHGLGTRPPTPHCAAGQVVRGCGWERRVWGAGWVWSRVLGSTLTLVVPSHCVFPALGVTSLCPFPFPDCHTIPASCQVPGQARVSPICLHHPGYGTLYELGEWAESHVVSCHQEVSQESAPGSSISEPSPYLEWGEGRLQ